MTGTLLVGLCTCQPSEPGATAPTQKDHALTSPACAQHHAAQFEAWKATDVALPNRLPRPEHKTPTTPSPDGRWQSHELAYESAKGAWFNVFDQEHRRPGECGHLTGRGMNWNTMSAQYHMTGYKPNDVVATDSFHATWIEQGIGCIQCHGKPVAGHGQSAPASPPRLDLFQSDRTRMMHTGALTFTNELPAEAAQRDPTQAQSAYSAALAYSEAGMTVEAELWLRNTVKRDPDHESLGHRSGLCACTPPFTRGKVSRPREPRDGLRSVTSAARGDQGGECSLIDDALHGVQMM